VGGGGLPDIAAILMKWSRSYGRHSMPDGANKGHVNSMLKLYTKVTMSQVLGNASLTVSKAHKPYAEVREPDSAVQHQWGSYSWRVRYYSCGRLSSCRPESLAYSRLVKFARPEQNMTALLFPSMDQYVSDLQK